MRVEKMTPAPEMTSVLCGQMALTAAEFERVCAFRAS